MPKIFNKILGIKKPVKYKIWFFQFDGQEKQELYKKNKYWHYTTPNGGMIGCSSLADAKGDLKYSGAKVWSVTYESTNY